jgi:hypothetical protein
MTQTVSSQTSAAAAGVLPGRRAAALAGVASALLFFLGIAAVDQPHGTDAELVAWWSGSGNQITAAVSMYLFVAAALTFLGFLTHLIARIRATDGGGQLSRLAFAGGVFFSTMLAVAAAFRGVVGKAVTFNDQPLPDVNTLRYLTQMSSVALGVLAMLGATVTIIVVSYAILRTGAFGRWLAWLGVLAAVVLLAIQATFAGELAIPAVLIWTVAASVAIWRSPATVSRAVAH